MSDAHQSAADRNIHFPAFLSSIFWWIVPLILLIYPRDSEDQGMLGLYALGVLALVASSVISAANRTKKWFVLFWMPPAASAVLVCLRGIGELIQAAETGPGDMAPLGGVAILIGMGAMAILLGATMPLLFLRPKQFPRMLTAIALSNTIAIAFAASRADYQANKQEVTIHLLDFNGQPIQGATLKYDRIGYGPGGKDVPKGSGVPIVSDAHGIVRPHLRTMRNELKGIIHHPQYQQVSFTLGMQFSKRDLTRRFAIGTESRPNIVHGSILVKEPLAAYIYLPPRYDTNTQNQMLNKKASTTLVADSADKSFLNVETGIFGSSPKGHLRFELYFEAVDKYERARLKVHALDGVGIQMLPPDLSFSEPMQYPERLFEIAPHNGYMKEIVIMEPCPFPGTKLFVSTRDNTRFHMLTVVLYTNHTAKTGRCLVQIVKNLASTRNLEKK
jgi:hypothetical protein